MSSRIKPVRGTEAQRAAGKALLTGECFYLNDHQRFLIHDPNGETATPDYIIGPSTYLGEVADATARKGLHTDVLNPWGCWPGDWCIQTGNRMVYLCVSNNGEADADWQVICDQSGHRNVDHIDNTDSPLTITDDHRIILGDTSTASITINLPPIAGSRGRELTIRKIGSANTLTIDADGAETIDGAATYVLNNNKESVTIIGNSTEWFAIAH